MRLMGLDIGDRTIGVAVSDELGLGAHPVTVLKRTDSVRKDIGRLRELAEQHEVERIVVGVPIMLSGETGVQAEKVLAFVDELRRRMRVPIETWDERLTTAEAERMLIETGHRREKRREIIDMHAAAVILQTYMDSRKSSAPRERADDEE
ncbi:MAG: Holliday junction resolvase RuvX [Armatimonadetes bacterium]|nr:Holliday junction resolvase RuvX [Armatimonadota bacterium]